MSDLNTTDEVQATSPGRPASGREPFWWFVEIFAVAGLAVAQPAFDALDRNVILFIARGSSTADLIGLTLFFLLVPPAIAWGVEMLVAWVRPTARPATHAVILGLFAVLAVIQALTQVDALPQFVRFAGAVAAGAAVVFLVMRFDARQYFRLLAVAPVLLGVLFAGFSPVAEVAHQGSGAQGNFAVDRPARIVMVVLDEMPVESLVDGRGEIDRQLFPNFARLADMSTWHRNTTTVAPFTDAAVPAILTGNYPTDEKTPAIASNYPRSIFTALRSKYAINAHESVTQVCPLAVCHATIKREPLTDRVQGLVEDTLDLYRDRFDANPALNLQDFAGVLSLDHDPLATGERFVEGLRPSARPRFDFLHVFLPHQGWRYLATGQDTGEAESAPGSRNYRWNGDGPAEQARQRHLIQVQATDRLLGQMLDRLESIGVLDDSLVVVTADHGAAFASGEPERGLSEKNEGDIAWVPLFIKEPNQRTGRVDDRHARVIDVLPTIADIIGLQTPWKFDGVSLNGPRPETKPRLLEWNLNDLEPDDGNFVTIDPKRWHEEINAPGWPATGSATGRLYKLGPYAGLFGREVASLPVSSEPPRPGRLTDPKRFAAVVPGARSAPYADVRGVASEVPSGAPVVVAVNGKIGGFATAYKNTPDEKVMSWWAVVPPALFRAGANDVRAYVVLGSPDDPELVAITANP